GNSRGEGSRAGAAASSRPECPKRRDGGSFSATDEGERVDLAPVAQHFEMDVGAGRAAGGAHEGDRLTAFHGLANRHERALVVRIARDEAIAVIDLYEPAVA